MSRFEGRITASGDARLSAAEMLALLGGEAGVDDERRMQAIACYLSGGEGWKDAVRSLGGAFASDSAATRLRERKAE